MIIKNKIQVTYIHLSRQLDEIYISFSPRQRSRKSSLCLYLEVYEGDKPYPSLKMQVLTHQLPYHVHGSL